MNQARLWLVVNPTLGLPLFLGGVIVVSLLVHLAVLTYSPWFPAFLAGKPMAQAVSEAAPAAATGGSAVASARD